MLMLSNVKKMWRESDLMNAYDEKSFAGSLCL